MRLSPARPGSVFVTLLAILLGGAAPSAGDTVVWQATRQGIPALSDSAVVSVLTVLPGDRLYSLFGHTIIRVRDPATGLDVGFNYGTFDFPTTIAGGAGFVARFAYGKLDYKLQASGNPSYAVEWYAEQEGRSTIEQTLDLSPGETEALLAFLVENARPENAVYRYDFFFDNCSTRPRDVLERVLGTALAAEVADPGTSLRRLLDPYLVANPGVDFSMDIGLGMPADRLATSREALFLPVELMKWLGAARVADARGRLRPLVSRTDTLTRVEGSGEKVHAVPWPLLATATLGAALVFLTVVDRRSGRSERRWLDGFLFLAAGVAGLVLGFLVFISLHSVTRPNLNLVWALPTHLVAGGVLLAGRKPGWLRPYMLVALGLAAIFLVGLPFWTQEIPAAVIPIVVAIAARSALLAFPPDSSDDSSSDQSADASSR
ncbi:MAG: DUF4105 domain-containing protein [marine benthic group bacterium]|nr:DUF4105 domain-containing protein [Gemmatimonadota bacterium]